MCGESGTSHTNRVHHYYKCVTVKKKRGNCCKKPVKKEWLEDLVVNETMKRIMDDDVVEAIVSQVMDLQEQENTHLPIYEQQLRETEAAIDNLLNAIQQGILTKSTKDRLETLEATKEVLEIKVANEKLAKPKMTAEQVRYWVTRFRKLDVRIKEHRKMLIDVFLNAVSLYDDKAVITFNYKDGSSTITFDDLKNTPSAGTGSDLESSGAPAPGLSYRERRERRRSLYQEGEQMALKDSWKKTGKELGGVFAGLGKSIVHSAGAGIDKLEEKVDD